MGSGRRDLPILLAAAWLLRAGLSVLFPNQQHSDEVYEYIEQAYRVVIGGGLVPWEFQYAARSWLVPTLLAPVVWSASLSAFTRAHLPEIAGGVTAVVTLAPVAAAYLWTDRVAGRRAAWVAGAFAACWFELGYAAAKPTQEVIGGSCLVLGLLWLSSPGDRGRRALAGGLSLGLAIAFRLQLAPAVLVAAGFGCWRTSLSTVRTIAVGVVLGVAVGGLADWIGWSYPFEGYIRYAIVTTKGGMASWYGVKPFYYYASQMVAVYSVVALPFALAVLAGASRYAAPFATAAVIVLSHSIIPHKEYRFVIPATMLLVPLAAVGIGIGVEWLSARWSPARVVAPLAVATCLLVSLTLALLPRNRPNWTHRASQITAFRDVSGEVDACGVGIPRGAWSMFPGESGMARPVPIFETDAPSRNYNYAVTIAGTPPPDGFQLWKRYWTDVPADRSEQVDLYKRAGGCETTQEPLRLLPVPEAVTALWGPK